MTYREKNSEPVAEVLAVNNRFQYDGKFTQAGVLRHHLLWHLLYDNGWHGDPWILNCSKLSLPNAAYQRLITHLFKQFVLGNCYHLNITFSLPCRISLYLILQQPFPDFISHSFWIPYFINETHMCSVCSLWQFFNINIYNYDLNSMVSCNAIISPVR